MIDLTAREREVIEAAFPGRVVTLRDGEDEDGLRTFAEIDGDIGDDVDWQRLVGVHQALLFEPNSGVHIVLIPRPAAAL